jgi:hypothetical protein
MDLLLRRLWRTFGWLGVVGLAFTILVLILLGTRSLTWDSKLINILRPVLLLIVGLGVAGATWGYYAKGKRPVVVRPPPTPSGHLLVLALPELALSIRVLPSARPRMTVGAPVCR